MHIPEPAQGHAQRSWAWSPTRVDSTLSKRNDTSTTTHRWHRPRLIHAHCSCEWHRTPKRVEATLRQTLHGLDASLPFVKIETLGEVLNPQIRPWRLGASVFTAFGILAVILAVIGLWSSVAYAVSQRTQEFAVRMTLGAHRSSLVALMLKEGVRNALAAITAGLALAAIGQPLHCRSSLWRVLARSARVHYCRGRDSYAGYDCESAASMANFAN